MGEGEERTLLPTHAASASFGKAVSGMLLKPKKKDENRPWESSAWTNKAHSLTHHKQCQLGSVALSRFGVLLLPASSPTPTRQELG